MKRRRLLVLLLIVVSATLVWRWYRAHHVRLSQEPRREAGTLALTSRDSVLTIHVDVPLAVLRGAAESSLPSSYAFSGNGDDACVDLGILGKHCAGTHYEGSVQRSGDITLVGNSDDTVRMSLPLKIEGRGGLRGDGARLLQLDAKNFRASVVVSATVAADVGTDWCPIVTVTPGFNWTETPRVEIVERVWTVVTGQVEPTLRKKLDELAQKVRDSIACDDLKREVRKVWRVYSLPLADALGAPAYANVIPKTIGFSGVRVTPDAMSFTVSLTAATEISTTPAAGGTFGDLPPMARIDDVPGRLALSVPVRVDYEVVRTRLLQELQGRTFVSDTSGGSVHVEVEDVFVYPSGDRLALGIEFSATMPEHLFDAKGRVYLTARPTTDKGGKVISLDDLEFSRVVDNEVWSMASVVFEQQIKASAAESARFDLTSELDKLEEAVVERLAGPVVPGFSIKTDAVEATIDRIVPETNELSALVFLDVGLDVTVSRAPVESARRSAVSQSAR